MELERGTGAMPDLGGAGLWGCRQTARLSG
jgi:hypothetical protein